MITDALTMFFDTFSLAGAAAGTAVVSNVIDLGSARDIGRGQPLRLRIQCDTTFTSGGALTLAVEYDDSPNPDGSGSTQRVVAPTVALAGLTAGAVLLDLYLPDNLQRYLVVKATPGTAAVTAGAISAFILFDSDTPQGLAISNYPSAVPSTGF
jgi:hypothetical protein